MSTLRQRPSMSQGGGPDPITPPGKDSSHRCVLIRLSLARRSSGIARWQPPCTASPPPPCRRAPAPQAVSPGLALLLLATARLASVALNIIHDCDESFNYLEPLHYLLYGYGMQTWEYSARFALRAYLYLLLHGAAAAPAVAVLGAGAGEG